jgi:hypothetical protein
MLGFLPAHQVLDVHRPRSHLLKHLSVHMMVAEDAMNADLQQMVHTLMLKSSAPKLFLSRSMKFENY